MVTRSMTFPRYLSFIMNLPFNGLCTCNLCNWYSDQEQTSWSKL